MAGKTKKFLVISLALSLIFLSATAGMAEKKTLTVGTFAWIIKKFPTRDITEKFMRDHPDVNVNIQTLPIADFVPKLLADWKIVGVNTLLYIFFKLPGPLKRMS